eukprot:10953872-Alexandrium_andersonii.AAC.1
MRLRAQRVLHILGSALPPLLRASSPPSRGPPLHKNSADMQCELGRGSIGPRSGLSGDCLR